MLSWVKKNCSSNCHANDKYICYNALSPQTRDFFFTISPLLQQWHDEVYSQRLAVCYSPELNPGELLWIEIRVKEFSIHYMLKILWSRHGPLYRNAGKIKKLSKVYGIF